MTIIARWIALTIATVLASALSPAFAQTARDARPTSVSLFGSRYDGFRLLFDERGCVAGDFAAIRNSDPRNCLVVILGDTAPTNRLPGGLLRFLHAGGAVLIADDRAASFSPNGIDLEIRSGPVSVTADVDAFAERSVCPIVRSFRGGELFRNVRAIACNICGYLAGRLADELALAWLPQGTIVPQAPGVPPPVIAGGEVGNGRLLVVADQSVFVNEMLLQFDNLPFAGNAVEWLLAGRDPSECCVYFFESGNPVDRWIDPRFETGNWSSLSLADFVELINQLVIGIEDENVVNDLISGQQARLRPDVIRHLIVIGPTAILALLSFLWLWRGRAPSVALQSPRAAQSKSTPGTDSGKAIESTTVGALALRRQAIAEGGNYSDPGRQLARQFFHNSLKRLDDLRSMPTITVAAGFWTRCVIRWKIGRLWNRATADRHQPLTAAQFGRLHRNVAELRQLVERGIVVFHAAQDTSQVG